MRLLGSLIALVALLTACSDDPEPKFAEPSKSPPVSEATEQRESAKDFLRRWVEAEGDFYVSGDSSALTAMSAPTCDTCDRMISGIEKIHDDGGSVEDFAGAQIRSIAREARNRFIVHQVIPGYRYRQSATSDWVEVPRENYDTVFELARRDPSWRVVSTSNVGED